MPRLVFGLGEEGAADARVVGRKAATLARLRSAGFPVPDGFVLTVDAVSRIPPSGGPVPADVRAALASALEAHGAGELAVRSSGVAEDLAGASFAGQYESVLGVRGLEELVSAVSRCRASALSERVSSYRAGARDAGMAVLAQDMVDADAAGVAFTANPVTGDTETVVNAVRGFGERLVSGEATPDEWVVRGTEVVSLARPEGAIDADEARRVADLARRVEEEFGGPQDIEWALAGGSLILLQARPITALPRRPELEPVGEGFWQKDAMHLPLPLTPFGASVYLPALRQGFRPMIEQFGLLLEGADLRSRGGEMYMRIIPVGGKDREPPPWWVLRLMSHLMPAIRRRERIAAGALRTDAPRRLIEQWNARWRDEFRHEASMLGGRDLAALEDEELLRHLDAAQAFLNRGRETHMLLDGAYAVSIYRLGQVAQELLGWDAVRTLALVSGTSAASSEPGRALETLTAAIAASASGCDVISQAGADVLERLHEVAPDAAGAFESYLEEHGRRTLSYDPGDVTLAERPELLAGLIRGRLSGAAAVRDPDAARREVVAQARSALATATEEERARFERALAAAEHAYPVREENVIWTDNVPSGLLRYTAVEIGRRLAERGAIAHAEDAVFLEQKELRAALRGGPRALRDLVAQRRAERAWVIAHPGPPSYGTEPSKPDLRGLPPAVRLVTGAVLYFLELSQPGARAEDGGIAGVPGSPGLHTGPARLIHEESEFSRLQPGDVLVCPITSPAWSLLFAQAGAVVTDGGGVLAHAAVIAREYAIPAVLATGDATRRLHDGELVTVDGTAGLVRIDAPAASAG